MIPEIEARNIVLEYTGFNNVILDWKRKFDLIPKFSLTRQQAEYVLTYHNIKPKVALKHITITSEYQKALQVTKNNPNITNKIWCEKLLCESDKAYHIWGKIHEEEKIHAFWLPKYVVIVPEKELGYEVDYSPYNHRPPLEHQKTAIEKLLANDKYILALDMGTGKSTSAVIASIEAKAKKILVICPASLKINWKREIEFYSDDEIFIIDGKKWGENAKYYIINYDIVKNFHEVGDTQSMLSKANFDLAIVDEAHFLANETANRTKLINDILKNVKRVWLLTGTPMTSRPINYFNLLKLVGSNLTDNWQQYVKRYCAGYQFKVGKRKIWNVNGASNLDELRERTKNVVLRMMKSDIMDLPEKTITPIYLELKSNFYEDELEEFVKITSENKHKESLAITINRLMSVRQVIANEKIEYTCELIDKCLEQDKKVIVFTNFTNTLDTIYEKYKKKSVKLDGRMSKEKRQESVDKFQQDDKIKIFVSNIIAGGAGITLTAAEVVIMNDLSFVPAHHSQAEDRTYRYGQKNNIIIYYPIFENTIEMNIFNMLEKKKNIIDQVLGDNAFSENFSKDLLSTILKK